MQHINILIRPRKTLGYETPSVLFLNLFQPLLHLKSESKVV